MIRMIELQLNEGVSGYDAVADYIQRYWEHNITDTVVVSLGISYDGSTYELVKEVASPIDFNDVEFLNDWWEGQKFIRLIGIRTVQELDVRGGIYPYEQGDA